jgi:hypothetical protein
MNVSRNMLKKGAGLLGSSWMRIPIIQSTLICPDFNEKGGGFVTAQFARIW